MRPPSPIGGETRSERHHPYFQLRLRHRPRVETTRQRMLVRKYGYTFPDPAHRVHAYSHWDADDAPTSSTRTIYLLKLHGSLNWQFTDIGVRLKQRLHAQRGSPSFEIIPPGWNKQILEDETFRALWKNAERAIRNAKSIAIVGFSFTPTDLHAESLFRIALARERLRTVVIANPSQQDRYRIRQVFSRSLERDTVVRQYDGFDQFVSAFPECMD